VHTMGAAHDGRAFQHQPRHERPKSFPPLFIRVLTHLWPATSITTTANPSPFATGKRRSRQLAPFADQRLTGHFRKKQVGCLRGAASGDAAYHNVFLAEHRLPATVLASTTLPVALSATDESTQYAPRH